MSCHWLVMLSMEPTLFIQSSSCAKVTDASRDLGCNPWSIHQPLPSYQTGALASAGAVIYEGVAYCAMSQFLTLRANGRTLTFWFCVIRVYHGKLGHILKPLVPKFRPDFFARLRHTAEKQIPTKLKPIVGVPGCRNFVVYLEDKDHPSVLHMVSRRALACNFL